MSHDGGEIGAYGITSKAVQLYLDMAAGHTPTRESIELRELAEAGLVVWDASLGHAWITAPEFAIEDLRNRQLGSVETLLGDIQRLLHSYRQLPFLRQAVDEVHKAEAPDAPESQQGSIRHLTDKTAINALAGRLASGAVEIRTSNPGDAPSAANLAASYERDLPLLRAHPGMVWRTLYSDSARADPATCQWARDVTAAGGDVRTTAMPIERWMIFGQSDVLLADARIADHRGAIHISDTAAVTALARAYDTRFVHFRPFTGPNEPERVFLTEEQHRVMHVLLQGRPRKSIATLLGITDKTLARRIAAIEELFGVKGDVALGYAYARWEQYQPPA